VAGSCEHDNKPSGSIKCWEILEELSNWWLLKKDSIPLNYFLKLVDVFICDGLCFHCGKNRSVLRGNKT
jgi:hypothetical protein